MDEWQPIETAPKSGTELLLYDVFVFVGRWADGLGWWDHYGHCSPTHWMPLPEPPIVGEMPEFTFTIKRCGTVGKAQSIVRSDG